MRWIPRLGLICVLLLAGCAGRRFRPEELDDAAMRAWIENNWRPLQAVQLSWRGMYQDADNEVPFRLDLDWSPDSARLALCSPFGGELAVFRCDPEKLRAGTGSALPSWLERAADALGGGAGEWLEWGAARLAGLPEGVSVELKDPALGPLLLLALDRLPEGVLDEGLCRRATVGAWLWGEWRPEPGARWLPAERRFLLGDSSWTIHEGCGLVERVERGGWRVELDEFERRPEGPWLPGRLRLSQPAEQRRVVLQLREARLTVTDKE
jgi:hypothetical protein